MVARVPVITPNNIANVKLRMDSPPRMKIHNSTNKVEPEVMMVRLNVVLMDWLTRVKKSWLG